ncbi:hypothetical protein GCM10027176_38330 [Actinoallomurus bryophytorum]
MTAEDRDLPGGLQIQLGGELVDEFLPVPVAGQEPALELPAHPLLDLVEGRVVPRLGVLPRPGLDGLLEGRPFLRGHLELGEFRELGVALGEQFLVPAVLPRLRRPQRVDAPVTGRDPLRGGDELPAAALGLPDGGVGELFVDVLLADLLDPPVRPLDRLTGPEPRLTGHLAGRDARELLPGEVPVVGDLLQGGEPAFVVRFQAGPQLRVERPGTRQFHRLPGELGLLVPVPGLGLGRPFAVRAVALRRLLQAAAEFGDRPGLGVQPQRLVPDALGELGRLRRRLVRERRLLLGVARAEPGELLLVPAARRVVPLVRAPAQVEAALGPVDGERRLERAVRGGPLPPLRTGLYVLPAQLLDQAGPFGVAPRGAGQLTDEAFPQRHHAGVVAEAGVPLPEQRPPGADHLTVEHLVRVGDRVGLVQPPGELLTQGGPAAGIGGPSLGEPPAQRPDAGGGKAGGVTRVVGHLPFERDVRLVALGDLGAQPVELLPHAALRLDHPGRAGRGRRLGHGLDLGHGHVHGFEERRLDRLSLVRDVLDVRPAVLGVARRPLGDGRGTRALLRLRQTPVLLGRSAGDVQLPEVQGPFGVLTRPLVHRVPRRHPRTQRGEIGARRAEQRRLLIRGHHPVPAVGQALPERLEPLLVLLPRAEGGQGRMTGVVVRLGPRAQTRHPRRVDLGAEVRPGLPQRGAEDVALGPLLLQHGGKVARHSVGLVEDLRRLRPEVLRRLLERLVRHGVPATGAAGELAHLAGQLVEPLPALGEHAVEVRLEGQPVLQGGPVRLEVLPIEGGLAPRQLGTGEDAGLRAPYHRLVRLGHRRVEVRADPFDVLGRADQARQRLVGPAQHRGTGGVLVEPRGDSLVQPFVSGGQLGDVLAPFVRGQLRGVTATEEPRVLRAQVVAQLRQHRVVIEIAAPLRPGLLTPDALLALHLVARAGQQSGLGGLGAQPARPAVVQVAQFVGQLGAPALPVLVS